jgi:hypothetical protein
MRAIAISVVLLLPVAACGCAKIRAALHDGPGKEKVHDLGRRLVERINAYRAEHGRWPTTIDQLGVEFPRDQYTVDYCVPSNEKEGENFGFVISVTSGPHKWTLISVTGVWGYDDGSD